MSARSIGSVIGVAMLALCVGAASAANLRSQVDRTRIAEGDILAFQLIAEGEVQAEPDFTPLQHDFDILSQGQSQVTSIVNGRISHTRQWNLQIAPKRAGTLRIPAIAAGPDQSQPVTIEVVDERQAQGQAGAKPLFVRAEVDNASPYVQQVLDYRVKVYFSQEPQRAVLSEPQAEGATIQQSGDDRAYDESIDGQLYRVIERRYQIIPQRSGALTILAPRLEAMLPDPSRARSDPFADLDEAFGGTLFDRFPQIPGFSHPGRRVVERAEDVRLDVRPQPADAGTSWLPASSIQLADEWSPSPPVFRVGEPVTRTVTLTATGITAAQLPDLALGTIEGAQVYPDQPRAEDLREGAEPGAVKTFKIALVPTRAGTLTLPEIRLPWWDTAASEARVAVIPTREVEVADAPGVAPPAVAPESPPAAAASAPESSSSPPDTRPRETGLAMPEGQAHDRVEGDWAILWPVLVAVMGAGWGLTLLWGYRQRRRRVAAPPRREPSVTPSAGVDAGALRRALRDARAAFASNDPRAARARLLEWGCLRWPDRPVAGLDGLAQQLGDSDAATRLRSIDRAIYAPPGSEWDGPAFWTALEPVLSAEVPERGEGSGEDGLPELYPKL